MENLVDIENYCNFLSSITNIDIDRVKVLVILYFSCVADGKMSFSEACLFIENELVKEMTATKIKRILNTQKQKEQVL